MYEKSQGLQTDGQDTREQQRDASFYEHPAIYVSTSSADRTRLLPIIDSAAMIDAWPEGASSR
jgi:hypothetical protein